MSAGPPPVFAHSMWRTGSTYLASRFAASGRHLLFYEPFHEYAGSRSAIARARAAQADKLVALRHPDVGGGYFDNYLLIDPQTGLPLWRLCDPRSALRAVYDVATPRSIAFLRACVRVAQAQGKTAFFGFCRSGTQFATLVAAQEGTHFHLWRCAREQFESYSWPANDYFLPGTVLQLLLAPRWQSLARTLAAGKLEVGRRRLVLLTPDRMTAARYRLGRGLANSLATDEAYALFYLSWLLSRRAARDSGVGSWSLTGLAREENDRRAFERAFHVDLAGMRPTPAISRNLADYTAIEARVRAALDRHESHIRQTTEMLHS